MAVHLLSPHSMQNRRGLPRIPWSFVLLLLALSLPFWVAAARTRRSLAPGLPVSALMAVCPAIAAVLLSGWQGGAVAVRALLREPLDYWKVQDPRWFVVALALKPAVMVVSYALMRWTGMTVPSPHLTIVLVAATFAVFFIAAVAEEIGWTAYLTDRMTRCSQMLPAAIAVGIVWAAWHLVPLSQANRSPVWIAWHALETVASRVLIVWLYDSNQRCVFLAVLYHASDNVSWLLFPEWGSHYSPGITGPISAAVAFAALAGPARAGLYSRQPRSTSHPHSVTCPRKPFS